MPSHIVTPPPLEMMLFCGMGLLVKIDHMVTFKTCDGKNGAGPQGMIWGAHSPFY